MKGTDYIYIAFFFLGMTNILNVVDNVMKHNTIMHYEEIFAKTECVGYDSVAGKYYIKE